MSKKLRRNSVKDSSANSLRQNVRLSKKRGSKSTIDAKVSHINNSKINISNGDIINSTNDFADKENGISKSIQQELSRQRAMMPRSEELVERIVKTKRPLRVFLCHSSSDKAIIRKLYNELRNQQWVDPWLDEEKLLPGENWNYEIKKAVRTSDVVIVCLSVGSVNKEGYLQREIVWALDAAEEKMEDAIFIVPLKLEKCNVPQRLSKWHWLNYFEDNAYEKLLSSLQKRAKALNILG